jgi:RNA polymerase sigma-70 factor (ECF subfamily)
MAALPVAEGHEAAQLRAAARGKPEAVRWLLDEVAPVVHGFVWARVAGDQAVAEDLLQETLLAAVRSADTFRGDAAVSTWMCGIARHLVARHWEAERRRDVAQSRLQVVPDPDREQQLLDRDEVAAALSRLPALHRQVLVLKYLDELPVQDIAEQVGRTKVQVQSLLQRARDGLRRELGGSDGDG